MPVTANQVLVAARTPELFAAAGTGGVLLLLEAAVGEGCPIDRPLSGSLAAFSRDTMILELEAVAAQTLDDPVITSRMPPLRSAPCNDLPPTKGRLGLGLGAAREAEDGAEHLGDRLCGQTHLLGPPSPVRQ